MPWIELTQLLALTAASALTMVLGLWMLGILLRDVSIIDMAFAAMIAAVILIARYAGGAQGAVADLITVLVLVWAARLTAYLMKRNLGRGEDPRYTRLRGWVEEGWPFHWLALRQVFLLQGAVIWALTLPQQIAMLTGGEVRPGWLAVAGVLLWLVGFFFETLGDYQLSRFRADPGRRGQVLDTGLWRYTRHPNYFGELCQWWGLFLVALEAPWAWCALPGPLLYTYLVVNVTGQRTLDKKLAREKPEYVRYMRTTSGLLPRPPRAP